MANLSTIVLLPIVLLVVGCETSTKRECPAFFHPDYQEWAQQGVGETLIFTDQNGLTETFTVTEITFNEPFSTRGFGSSESNISCDLTASEVLVGTDSSEIIIKQFEHSELSDTDLADEFFILRVDFSQGTEGLRQFDFGIDLGERSSLIASTVDEQLRFSELEIGDVLYQDVITEEILEEQFFQNPDQVRIVAIARGIGLVQYTRVNGSVFSLVP